jgi:hypothetical protein
MPLRAYLTTQDAQTRCFSLSTKQSVICSGSSHSSLRTKSRIEHVECHLVTFLGSRNGDKTFIAVVLRLIDFDDTSTELTDLVDLSTTLAYNSTYHVVGNVNLLCQWLARDNSLHGLIWWTSVVPSSLSTVAGLLRTHASIASCRGAGISQRDLRLSSALRGVWLTVGIGR